MDGRHNFALAVLQVCEGLILRNGVLLAVARPSIIISQECKVILENVGHLILLQGVITPERQVNLTAEQPNPLVHQCASIVLVDNQTDILVSSTCAAFVVTLWRRLTHTPCHSAVNTA